MMKTRIWTGAVLTLAIVALGIGCGDGDGDGDGGPMGPVAGSLTIDLTTPNVDDGALMFTLSGATIDTITVVNAVRDDLYFRRLSGSSVVGVVVGDMTAGSLLQIDVPDVGEADAYVAAIVEVANRTNDLRASLTGYELTVESDDS